MEALEKENATMLASLRRRMTYANVMATLAVFVALGGSSYAAAKIGSKEIKNNSIQSKDIKNNQVSAKDVKNGSLLGKDFKAGELPAGVKGATGATGARGATGATGAKGATGAAFPTGNLPSGRTLKGVYSLGGGAGADRAATQISFPVQLATAPDVQMHRVVPAEPGEANPVNCPGSASNPLAAAGFLCIYEANRFGTAPGTPGLCKVDSNICNNTGGTTISTRWGMFIQFTPTVADTSTYGSNGTWAVTAP